MTKKRNNKNFIKSPRNFFKESLKTRLTQADENHLFQSTINKTLKKANQIYQKDASKINLRTVVSPSRGNQRLLSRIGSPRSKKIPGKKNEDYQNVQSKFKDTSSEVNKLLNEKEKFHQMIDKRKKEASFRKHLG